MAKKFFALGVVVLGAVFSMGAQASQSEASYLNRFSGSWSGAGQASTVVGNVSLNCAVRANASGANLRINGVCKGPGITRRLAANLRYKGGRYSGSWHDGTGGAGLSGVRRGGSISLTVGSKSGGAPGRMVLQVSGRSFHMNLNEGGQRVRIAFHKG